MELEGWLLHKIPQGETSVKITVFTKEAGLLQAWQKGGRSPKKQALLRPFLPLWLSVDTRREYHYLRQAEGLALPLEFQGNALFSAYYLNELLYYILKPGEAFDDLYQAYQYTLNALSAPLDPLPLEALLRRFEWILLKACGYALSFSESEDDPYYRYSAGQGFVRSGAEEAGIDREIVLGIIAGQFSDRHILRQAKPIMRLAIDHLLEGRKLHSRTLLKIRPVPLL